MYKTLINKLDMNTYGNSFYIKREDLIPISFGGNKARKAVIFFDEFDRNNFDSIVTYGSSSSNHCRIIANMCANRKIPCYIISPNEGANDTFNKKLMALFNAKIIITSLDRVQSTIQNKLNELKSIGKKPYFIQGGGHGNLGTQAYVDCYKEIKEYENEHNIKFNYIFFASGTGTTQSGLVCGQFINNDDRKIVGISIARKNPKGREVILESIYNYLDSKNIKYIKEKIEKITIFDDSYIGDGYGKENNNILSTIKEVLINYGIPLDSTYTGKAFDGMKKYIKKNNIKNKTILFIHTGGTPLFFDDLERM